MEADGGRFDQHARKGLMLKNTSKIYSNFAAGAALLAVLFYPAPAQHRHQTPEYAPALNFAALPAPPLMTGIGTSRIKITTRSETAQKYFNQGLNLLHAFWDTESYRAFREAVRSDPNCAMGYWGIYNALAQNSQEMAEERGAALKKAVELMPDASEHERFYIRAIQALAEPGKGRAAWIAEMEALIDKYPDDPEAKLLLANSLSTPAASYLPDGRPRDGKIYGQMILRNLLATHPNHAAVHHYWIHAVENGARPEEALPSCEKLARLAPNAGHLLHMPGHIYYRLGMYEKARKSFLASLEFDLKYMKEQKIHPINNWNYTHNLDYLVANSAEEGRFTEAAGYAKMLAEVPSDEQRLKATGLGYLLYGGYTAPTRLRMRFGLWDAAAQDVENSLGTSAAPTLSEKYQAGILSYLKGMGAAEKNDAGAAEKAAGELEKIIQELATGKVQQASDWYFNYANRVLAVHLLDLRGSLLSIRGNPPEAVKLLAEAVEKEKNLGYWEPPHYTRPVLESLGAAYARAGRYEEARAAFERVLKARPNSGFAYLATARVFAKSGDKTKASEFYRQFLKAWANADADLAAVGEARDWLRNN
jgi:tetratricopeptide (TPR) repeat protein